LLIFINIS